MMSQHYTDMVMSMLIFSDMCIIYVQEDKTRAGVKSRERHV